MKNSEVPMATLSRAVKVCKGMNALGDALNVSTESLERMIAGEEDIPQALFIQAVGLLLDATAGSRGKPPKPDSNESGRKGPRH